MGGETPGEVPADSTPIGVDVTATPSLPDAAAGFITAPGLRPAIPIEGDRTVSGAMVTNPERGLAYLVDGDNGSIERIDHATTYSSTISVGEGPERIVRVGDDLFITLRGAGELVRLHESGDGLVETDRVSVGAEPVDLAISHHADRLYIALSQEGGLLALDATTLEAVGFIALPGEPTWVATAEQLVDGEEVFFTAQVRVAKLARHVVSADSVLIEWLGLPERDRFSHESCPDVQLKARVTGPPVISNGHVYVPTLYADTDLRTGRDAGEATDPADGGGTSGGTGGSTPVPPPDMPSDTAFGSETGLPGDDRPDCTGIDIGPEGGPNIDDGGGSYGVAGDPMAPGRPSRFTPVLVDLLLDAPEGDDVGEAISLATAFGFDELRGDFSREVVRSYAAELLPVPGTSVGRRVLATLPGSSAIVVVDLEDDEVFESAGTLEARARLAKDFGTQPRHAAWMGDDLLLASPTARRVYRIDGVAPEMLSGPLPRSFDEPRAGLFALDGVSVSPMPTSKLPANVKLGRLMFFDARDASMSGLSTGVSCETCHQGGRNDGFTWIFDDMPRQTPTLAGLVSDTLPLTWLGDVATVVDEIHATTQQRMGGGGLDERDASRIAAYVDATPVPVRPRPAGVMAESVERGKALFESGRTGCVTCHNGKAFTDGKTSKVLGFPIATNTPSLLGIGGTAPYFHDGSAATLADVLERVRDGSMGSTKDLSDAEMVDLENYLKTL